MNGKKERWNGINDRGQARFHAFADRRGIAALYVVPRGAGWQIVPSREFPRLRRSA